jgi:hypothetical protein
MRLPRTAPVFVKHSSEQNKANKFVTIPPMTRAASPSHLKYENATTITVVDRQFIRFPAFSFLRALPQPGGAHYCIRLIEELVRGPAWRCFVGGPANKHSA